MHYSYQYALGLSTGMKWVIRNMHDSLVVRVKEAEHEGDAQRSNVDSSCHRGGRIEGNQLQTQFNLSSSTKC